MTQRASLRCSAVRCQGHKYLQVWMSVWEMVIEITMCCVQMKAIKYLKNDNIESVIMTMTVIMTLRFLKMTKSQKNSCLTMLLTEEIPGLDFFRASSRFHGQKWPARPQPMEGPRRNLNVQPPQPRWVGSQDMLPLQSRLACRYLNRTPIYTHPKHCSLHCPAWPGGGWRWKYGKTPFSPDYYDSLTIPRDNILHFAVFPT